MTTPLRQPALDDVNALADALDRAQTTLAQAQATNADLLVVQGNLNNQIGTLTAKVTDLEAQLAGQQPTPQPPPPSGILWGSNLAMKPGETRAAAVTRLEKNLGPLGILRDYSSSTAATLATAVSNAGLTDGKRALACSFKDTPASVTAGHYDTDILALARVSRWLILWHEPDQNTAAALSLPKDATEHDARFADWHAHEHAASDPSKRKALASGYTPRINPADLIAAYKHMRTLIDNNGLTGKCKLTLCLTGTALATRLPMFYPGHGVLDCVAIDPYVPPGKTAQSYVGPMLDTIHSVCGADMPAALFETGLPSSATTDQVAAYIKSLSWLDGKVEAVAWFNQPGNAALGNEIDNVPALASAFKGLT